MTGLTARPAASAVLLAAAAVLLAGCASEGVRYDPAADVVRTQDFNSTDLNIIVKKGAAKLVKKAERNLGRDVFAKATLFVGPVANQTSDQIEPSMIQNFLKSEITDLAPVTLVARGKALDTAKGELKFQQSGLVDPGTAQRLGRFAGANYFVSASFSSQTSLTKSRGAERQLYFFNISLVQVATGKEIVVNQQIQKVAKKGLFGW